MTIDRTIEVQAATVLRERAVRQALVDRLVAQSTWSRFGGPLLASAATAFFLLFSSAWIQGQPQLVETLLAVALAVVVWLTVWLVEVTRRLRALTTILQKSGTLSRFVAEASTAATIR